LIDVAAVNVSLSRIDRNAVINVRRSNRRAAQATQHQTDGMSADA
jgi:hypothetical protein